MKNILLFSLMTAFLFSFGKCNRKKCCAKKSTTENSSAKINANEIWMRYDETKCENPWNFNWFVAPTDEQLAAAVKGELTGKEIKILEIRTSREKDFISCEACTCPNGFHYFVRIPKTETSKLTALKFYETVSVPENAAPKNTK